MGVINVTPDSFSDGGQWFDREVAIAHGQRLLDQGADILDIGGESTRPGASRTTVSEEIARVIPVIEELTSTGASLSVDTMRSEVADTALSAGAVMINDVSGGRADPAMAQLVADRGCKYVLSHWRGHSDVMSSLTSYSDVVRDVIAELTDQLEVLLNAGVQPQQVVLDPGLGFAKEGADNWRILARLHELMELGYPLLIGASRKRFLGELLEHYGAHSLPMFRDRATAAITALVAEKGVWGVRVHEVSSSVDAIRVATAIRMANNG